MRPGGRGEKSPEAQKAQGAPEDPNKPWEYGLRMRGHEAMGLLLNAREATFSKVTKTFPHNALENTTP